MSTDLLIRLAELEGRVRAAIKNHESTNPALTGPPHAPRPDHMTADPAFTATRPLPVHRRRQGPIT
ncbi:hypothetical protein SAMN04487818_106124 [Actinokineospora terrae]|uniref:Uncharacterized protein n=1 Tax=Actinokineospora terrae TaxID=155974 RepID=A0A1H9T8A0_9PSEU|nr:hypothetical protein SAMN04487818_106124 [Actinokineospora terrae]